MEALLINDSVRIPEDIISQKIGDETVFLNMASGLLELGVTS